MAKGLDSTDLSTLSELLATLDAMSGDANVKGTLYFNGRSMTIDYDDQECVHWVQP